MSQLNTEQLMAVYREGNMENGQALYPELQKEVQLYRAENDFLSYLREDFFRHDGVMYAVWEVESRYCAALRLEPYLDGLLLEALETAPDARRKGHAKSLITAVLMYLKESDINAVYSHVSKRNTPSLLLHNRCGFVIVSDSATYIDGTVTQKSYTLCYYL